MGSRRVTVAGRRITTAAFVDDLVLLGYSWDGMSRDIYILEEFCEMTRLRVNASNCHGRDVRP